MDVNTTGSPRKTVDIRRPHTEFARRYGPWAVITGASSGLGEEFARQIAALGLHLVLVARRQDRLAALADDLGRDYGVSTRVVPIDLAREDLLDALRPFIADLEIGLLVSNAGFNLSGPFTEIPLARLVEMLHVNCRASLVLTHEIGSSMARRGRGGIVVMSSISGFTPTPRWATYASTKAFNLFLAEALWHELRDRGVDVLAICPGGTRTEFQRVAGLRGAFGEMEVGPVVALALERIGRRRLAIPGLVNRLNHALARVLPRGSLIAATARVIRNLEETRKPADSSTEPSDSG